MIRGKMKRLYGSHILKTPFLKTKDQHHVRGVIQKLWPQAEVKLK